MIVNENFMSKNALFFSNFLLLKNFYSFKITPKNFIIHLISVDFLNY
jgi:hypothetical protein